MAKDDYHVLACAILSYLYSCLKKGREPDLNMYDADALNIEHAYWGYIIRHLYESGYVEGVAVIQGKTSGAKIMPGFMITPAGIEYLQDNSKMKSAREILLTLKSFAPELLAIIKSLF